MTRLALCAFFFLLLSAFVPLPPANAALRIFTEAYPPLSFAADGQVTGLATEVVRELLRRTATTAEIRLVPWREGYRLVREEPDTALFSTAMTPERKEQFQWVGPIGILETNLYAPRGSEIEILTLEAAKGAHRIATVAGYYSEQLLKQAGFANLESCDSEKEALEKLLAGKVQLVVGNNTALPAVLEKIGANPGDVKSVFNLSTDLTYLAFSRATPEQQVKRWQQALDEMKRDGTFGKIYARWLPAEAPPGILQLMTEHYPPVTFLKNGKAGGLVTDMVREIAARRSLPADIRVTSWKNAYDLALHQPNVVLFSTERTPQREKLFQWVGPVGRNSAVFYAKKGSHVEVKNLADARALDAIATTSNWFTEQYLKEEGFANLVSSPEPAESVRQLMEGRVRLSIFTDLTVAEIVREAGYRMEDLEPVFTVTRTDFYIAFSRGTPAAEVAAWQATLDAMKGDGTFAAICRRYLPAADLADLIRTGAH
ncbi:hypothetical protein JCM30471_11210 [Desulfuromonas carbonis]|uniref:substrate-binding periplasmic protein n=1 Tax=Desulfuromonas sp. DDH964 TaxID=1823759 RepID=UPI00078B1753|nr:transporter substrate-binding domain-containing protein [Desulfuromonas sp. DDH964]AMV72602.1 periplasmic substrate-binding histidine kinase [Desulfuromonas sp. DDH964]